MRQEQSKPLLDDMHAWLLRERETLSRSSEVLKPMNYIVRRWDDLARFLDDGTICLTNNCAQRALRGMALERRNWTFASIQRGTDRAAIMLTMITTCRLNDVDPKAWLADVLARIARSSRIASARAAALEWKLLRQPDKPPIRPPDRHATSHRARPRPRECINQTVSVVLRLPTFFEARPNRKLESPESLMIF
ncbi:IS66 C-terminal element [Bradyrhizobium shewense]|uniref:IS66 C-terminal element n=1 Tax=Bradyrhizobium shewense TaxID=1761772 RepID=A0A1C3XV83_9BRAD|nr:IS66 C-terminal element [Bradyrhizobium shewense]